MNKLKLGNFMATVGLLVIVFTAIFSYYNYTDVVTVRENYEEYIQTLKEAHWDFVKHNIDLSYEKAQKQSDRVANSIRLELLSNYHNLDELKHDMDNNTEGSLYSKIINNNIKGKYLDFNTDYNDMFVATRKGIQADKSIISSSDMGETRKWITEPSVTFNSALGNDAIDQLFEGNNKYIFWEVPRDGSKENSGVTRSSLKQMKEVFMREGIEGLKGFIFLVPSYIEPDTDIFGTPTVNDVGQRVDNLQLVVVQEFSIYDQITMNKNMESERLERAILEQKKVGETYIKNKIVSSVILVGFFFVLFISISIIQNLLSEKR